METNGKKIIHSHLDVSFVLSKLKTKQKTPKRNHFLEQLHKSHKIPFEFRSEKGHSERRAIIIEEKMQDKFHRIYIEDLNPRIMVGGHNKPLEKFICWLLAKTLFVWFLFFQIL